MHLSMKTQQSTVTMKRVGHSWVKNGIPAIEARMGSSSTFKRRKCCPFCVKGKCTMGPHRRRETSQSDIDNEVPVISLDYVGPKPTEDKSEKIDSLPILVGVDKKTKWAFAHMVPKKGLDAHTVKIVIRGIRLAGYAKMILQSAQEPLV